MSAENENQNPVVDDDDKVKEGANFEASRMFLLEDSTITEMPKFAENVFESLNKNTTQAEILFVLCYCLALESGFYPSNIDENDLTISSLYSYHFKNILEISKQGFPASTTSFEEDFSRLDVKYPSKWFRNSSDDDTLKITTSVMSGVKSNDFLIFTLTPNDSFPGKSVCLPLSRYVLSTMKKDFKYRVRNLKELSKILKDEVFVPLRNTIISEYSSKTLLFPGLQGLPFDITIYLVKFLKSLKDLQNLSKTCTTLREVCETEKKIRRTI